MKRYFNTNFLMTKILTSHGKFENAEHVIFECEKFTEQRNELIQHIEANGTAWPCTPNALISAQIFNKFKKFCESVF